MDTTEEVFKTIFGASKVTTSGDYVTVDTSTLEAPGAEAFLFVMKDGDRLSMFGTKTGFISGLDDVAFKPGEAVTWTATISTDAWIFVTAADES